MKKGLKAGKNRTTHWPPCSIVKPHKRHIMVYTIFLRKTWSRWPWGSNKSLKQTKMQAKSNKFVIFKEIIIISLFLLLLMDKVANCGHLFILLCRDHCDHCLCPALFTYFVWQKGYFHPFPLTVGIWNTLISLLSCVFTLFVLLTCLISVVTQTN